MSVCKKRDNGPGPMEEDCHTLDKDWADASPETGCSCHSGEKLADFESDSENPEGEQQLDCQEQLADARHKLAEAESKIADLRDQLEVKESNLEEMIARFQRLQADFDNFKRRTEREKEEFVQSAAAALVERLLPVLDNFERAAATAVGDEAAFREGIGMIVKQLEKVLEDAGLEPVDALNSPFDPNLHQAVFMVQDDRYEDNTVVEELQKGYLFAGKVIRPSMVKVSCKQ